MPTLGERSLRVALTGVVPDDDPTIIADMQAEIERLRAILDAAIRILSDDRLPLQSRVNDARSILAK